MTARGPGRSRFPGRLVRFLGGAYLLAVLALAALVYGPGERLWPVTLFLFGPRWVVALPLVPPLPLAAILDRRLVVELRLP